MTEGDAGKEGVVPDRNDDASDSEGSMEERGHSSDKESDDDGDDDTGSYGEGLAAAAMRVAVAIRGAMEILVAMAAL